MDRTLLADMAVLVSVENAEVIPPELLEAKVGVAIVADVVVGAAEDANGADVTKMIELGVDEDKDVN